MPLFVRVRPVLAAPLVAALWLAGCAAPRVAPPNVPPPVAPAPGSAAAAGMTVPPPATASTPASGSPYVWSDRMDSAASRLRSALLGSGVEVSQTTDQRLWLSLPGETAFAAGRSALRPPAGQWLDQVAATLKTIPQAEVQIVGNPDITAGAPTGSTALALDRAHHHPVARPARATGW
jgi:outer membrane protein OmpA-like peptidoglycan-associated protein